MGKALYREYRPKTLDDVFGQEHITETLKNALKKGAISHAYLFTGPRGVGKTSIARILAHEINNLPYDEESTHMDIIEIDAASNRRIDEIRDLRDKVHIAPTSAKYKVYIIDEVHMLTKEAFNALLKTLEEPPGHVVFILATTESHKVPETIISRTQRYSFKPITTEATVKHLRSIAEKEGLNISEGALELIADHGRGSFRDSISMLDQIASFDNDKITETEIATLLGVPDDSLLELLISSVANNDSGKLFVNMQKLRERGANPSKISQSIIALLRKQIENKSNVLDTKRCITIMKSLLPLTGVSGSFEAIEISLLDALVLEESANNNVNISKKPPNIPSKSENAKMKSDSITTESNLSTNKDDLTVEDVVIAAATSPESNNSWESVLTTLKATHNTLYGVLRMANANVGEDSITLTFQFEFHKKQLEQNKNMAVLKDIVTRHLGDNYAIISEVQKKRTIKPIEKPKADTENALNNISNIFGGAELLES